jgi:HK97 family phage portal protein
MRLLGFNFSLTRASSSTGVPANLQAPSAGSGGWWPMVRESFPGAWQRNIEIRNETILTYNAVYACVTLIAADIAKLGLSLLEQDGDGIWVPAKSNAFTPVLTKPNRYQNRIKFIEQWMVSKLLHGNTYVLKERDERNVVVAMYVLDPLRTQPLIAPDGAVYYGLSKDNLAQITEEDLVVPASEIIHDTMVPLYHPLVGVSPITACGLPAMLGLAVQNSSSRFFENGAQPGGILTAPGAISEVIAERLKKEWNDRFTGVNAGRVAVLGDGLKYEQMSVNPVDAQLIEQLKWTAETVCSCFHVPPYMIGVGPIPTYSNVEAINQQYYSQALQAPIESIELCLDEGLGLTSTDRDYGVEFNLEDLLRMDTATKVKTVTEGLKGIFTVNEARKKFQLPPTPGGHVVYLQQQMFSTEALNKRDSSDDPFKSAGVQAPKSGGEAPPEDDEEVEDETEDEKEILAASAQIAAWRLKTILASYSSGQGIAYEPPTD